MGQSPKSTTYNEIYEDLPLINGASDLKKDYIKPLKYTTDPKRLSQKGDYIFGFRATVGNITLVNEKDALGRGVGVSRPLKEIHNEFVYFQLIHRINILERSST